ncbi:phosphotransferase family protein [Dellaglioa sp. BT-FLS60]
MDFNLDPGWQLLPIGGDTGTAYMGTRAQEKVFLKQNMSPFLAALSVAGITPKLIWTKRISSGDTITAQEWLNGRNLNSDEMDQKMVPELLSKIHRSKQLKNMLSQVGGEVITPSGLLANYFDDLSDDLKKNPLLADMFQQLNEHQPKLSMDEYTVCHGDLNHRNWLRSDTNQLYLVDWESAKIADPAMDLSLIMSEYIPNAQWSDWLSEYHESLEDNDLLNRINWYIIIANLQRIKKAHGLGRFHEMNQALIELQKYNMKMN